MRLLLLLATAIVLTAPASAAEKTQRIDKAMRRAGDKAVRRMEKMGAPSQAVALVRELGPRLAGEAGAWFKTARSAPNGVNLRLDPVQVIATGGGREYRALIEKEVAHVDARAPGTDANFRVEPHQIQIQIDGRQLKYRPVSAPQRVAAGTVPVGSWVVQTSQSRTHSWHAVTPSGDQVGLTEAEFVKASRSE